MIIVSVDDHVVEPPNMFDAHLPAKYQDVGPRTVQERGTMQFVGGPSPTSIQLGQLYEQSLRVAGGLRAA